MDAINKLYDLSKQLDDEFYAYKALMRKTSLHRNKQELDSAIFYAKELLSFGEDHNDNTYIGKALVKLGLYHVDKIDLSQSFFYYNRAFLHYKNIGDSTEMGKQLHAMAIIQKSLGDYIGSKTTATDGLRYVEGSSDLRTLSGLYHIVSVANREQKNLDESLKYNMLAIELYKKPISEANEKRRVRESDLYILQNTRANILADIGTYNEAIAILSGLLKDSLLIKNEYEHPRILNNLGYIKWLNDPQDSQSENLMLTAIKLRQKKGDVSGLISSNTSLAKYYSHSDPRSALRYAEAAYNRSIELNNSHQILESLDLVMNIRDSLKLKNDPALMTHYRTARQRLKTIVNRNIDLYSTTRFENEKLEQSYNEQTLLISRQEKERILIIGIAVLIFTSSLFLILYLVQRHNQRIKIGRVEERREMEKQFSKKIHDELGNDIFYLINRIQTDPKLLEEKGLKVLNGLQEIYSKARNLSKDYTDIDTGDSYGVELMELLNSYSDDTVKIVTTQVAPEFWNPVAAYKKKELFRVLQELLTNMKKHSKATFAAITFGKSGKKTLVNYVDNGVGCSLVKSGSGLANVENRIQEIDGMITFESKPDEGFKVRISISE